jgi:hypothetical protein
LPEKTGGMITDNFKGPDMLYGKVVNDEDVAASR